MNIISINDSKKYIHYGSEYFDKNRFVEIKNCHNPWNKPTPNSGLWGTPIGSAYNYNWHDWCLDNHYHIERLDKCFRFKLKDGSNVIKIHSNKDLDDILEAGLCCYSGRHPYLTDDDVYFDFEQLVKDGYDAIEVYVHSNRIYMSLYGWDCDSILVLNPDCIIEL